MPRSLFSIAILILLPNRADAADWSGYRGVAVLGFQKAMSHHLTSVLISCLLLALSIGTLAAEEPHDKVPPEVFEWPCWKGPVGGGVAPDPGFPLVDSLEQAKLVWESEDTIPIGSIQGFHWGSFSSPVVADGRLFICYVRAPGRELWENTEKPSR